MPEHDPQELKNTGQVGGGDPAGASDATSDAELLRVARAVRERAYAPYSRFLVGAAVLTADGRVFSGCNVENSSYGLAICAERAALCKAVSEGARDVRVVAIVADTAKPCPPCGACRQMLSELGPHCRVILSNLAGDVEQSTIEALLPGAFTPAMLRWGP